MFGCSNKPDGFQAFFIAVAGCVLQAILFGTCNSYGSMVSKIKDDPKFVNDKPTDTQLFVANSIYLGLFPFFGIFSGHLLNLIGSRLCCLVCVIGMVIALLATSASTNYHAVVALYGIFGGISLGFLLTPTAAVVSTWFVTKKSLGMTILFNGGGLGSLVIPPIVGALLSSNTWRRTMRYICIIQILGFLCAMCMKIRPGSENEAAEENAEANHEPNSNDKKENNSSQNNSENTNAEGNQVLSEVANNDVEERSVNTHAATLREWIFNIILTKSFLSLIFAGIFYCYGFYTYLVVNVPFPQNYIGKEGTIYANAKPISTAAATQLFIYYGVFYIIFGPIIGWLASKLTDRFVFAFFMVIGGVGIGAMAACRVYWAFAICNALNGIAVAAFGLIPSMVGKRFYGPNLGLALGINFFTEILPGFVTPVVATAVLEATNNYNGTLILGAIGYILSAVVVLIFIDDMPGKPVIGEGERQKKARQARA